MFTVSDVFSALSSYADTADFTEEQLQSSCEDGLNWVLRRLKDGVSDTEPLILETAAAMAHFYFYIRRLTEPDKYESYKVGDMTISQRPEKQFQTEREMRDLAIANASEILKDGGFHFCGT